MEMQDLKRDLRDVEAQVAEVMNTLNNVVHKSEQSGLILDFQQSTAKIRFFILERTADRSKSCL